ncbi:MAG: hypothetical protein JKY56_22365 [Kofleriaceae bacterium]|nr:hypothetical protein [Kofleriaceae bacterium]
MRLRSYIVLEVLAGTTLLAGLALGGLVFTGVVDLGIGGEAQAALPAETRANALGESSQRITSDIAMHAVESKLVPDASVAEVVVADAGQEISLGGSFGGVPDEELLAPLRDSPIASVRFNKGGSSISLRIDFENGARAAFKPRQTNWQSVPRREVIAFRINRLLGLSAVPPATGRKFEMRTLLAAIDTSSTGFRPRLKAEIVQKGGWVTGEISWWIPVIRRAKIDGFDIDSMEGIVSWKRYLRVNGRMPKGTEKLLAQISNMVLFDYVINNPDRWSGGNARVSDDRSILYFMDNTMSFGKSRLGHRKVRIYLQRSQVFSRQLVEKLRSLEEERVREVLAVDVEPFQDFLSDEEITALLARRDAALVYIDGLIAKYGEERVLAFP